MNRAEYDVWYYSAKSSPRIWLVSNDGGQVVAHLGNERDARADRIGERSRDIVNDLTDTSLPFIPNVEGGLFRYPTATVHVFDGWLVGFNKGEYGTALYWFSETGQARYLISNEAIVSIIRCPEGVYAIQGYDNHGSSIGSVLELSLFNGRWKTHKVTSLPSAPYSAVARGDTILIILANSLVAFSLGQKREMRTILPDFPWDNLYPRTTALSTDNSKLYIGMQEYVAEVDLINKQLRLLAPSRSFINKISDNQETKIRTCKWLSSDPFGSPTVPDSASGNYHNWSYCEDLN
jgi:hypothetical protein